MTMLKHTGPWADSPKTAERAALAEVNLTGFEGVRLEFSEGSRLEPVDPSRPAVDIEVLYSESRDQYRARLRQVPALVQTEEEWKS